MYLCVLLLLLLFRSFGGVGIAAPGASEVTSFITGSNNELVVLSGCSVTAMTALRAMSPLWALLLDLGVLVIGQDPIAHSLQMQ